MKLVLGLILMTSLISGCGQGDTRLSEKARIESEAATKKQIEVENENRAQRASEMEEDLQRRYRFYEATEGVYVGKLVSEDGARSIRISLIPSLPRYDGKRVRTYEEIAADLVALNFRAQVSIEVASPDSEVKQPSVGFIIENVRPDMVSGRIDVVSQASPNVYTLFLSGAGANTPDEVKPLFDSARGAVSAALTKEITAEKRNENKYLVGSVRKNGSLKTYYFSLEKVVE